MKAKEIISNEYVITIIGIVLLIGIIVFTNIKIKEHCVNNEGKLVVGTNGYSCIYEVNK